MSESLNREDQKIEEEETKNESTEAESSESAEGSTEPTQTPKKRRGFAVMDPKRVSEIASKGGKAAHAAGTAHEFSREEAREAGRKGGYATHARRKARSGQGAPPAAG